MKKLKIFEGDKLRRYYKGKPMSKRDNRIVNYEFNGFTNLCKLESHKIYGNIYDEYLKQ
jgi:hypothetical protein